jgi:hypothetical protein
MQYGDVVALQAVHWQVLLPSADVQRSHLLDASRRIAPSLMKPPAFVRRDV